DWQEPRSCSGLTASRTSNRFSQSAISGSVSMYPNRLRPLLDNDRFVPGSVVEIARLCDDWFRDDGSPAVFVVRSIFKGLIARGWDDEQGVPTGEFDDFRVEVLPQLRAVLATLPEEPATTLKSLVAVFRDFSIRPRSGQGSPFT